MKTSIVSIAALALHVVDGHICMWAPPQRGGAFEIVEPGQSICYLKQGPCGNVASGEPLATLNGGHNFNLLFQQNLNHFYQENPGRIQADFAESPNPTEEDFYPLGTAIPDWNGYNMITQTNFTMPVTIPNIECEHCVLRVRYISQNPTEDHGGSPSFHQCADVSVTKSVSNDDGDDHSSTDDGNARSSKDDGDDHSSTDDGDDHSSTDDGDDHSSTDDGDDHSSTDDDSSPSDDFSHNNDDTSVKSETYECCAAKVFTMSGYEVSDWRNPTQINFYFDANNRRFRIDTNSGNGITAKDGKFAMYNDFDNGIEYYYNVNTGVCELYGLNIWADWCYGSINSQVHQKQIYVGNEVADVWAIEGNNFIWTNTRESCVPVSKLRSRTGESTYYYNYHANSLPEDYFSLPAACVDAYNSLKGSRNMTAAPSHVHETIRNMV